MKWTPAIHEDLLMSVFQVAKLTGDQTREILRDMHSKGYDFTDRALSQHIQKLRKTRDTSGLQSPAGVSKKSSPAKPKTPSGKRKQGAFKPFNFGLDDDEIKPEFDDDSALGGSPVAKRIKAEDGLATEDA